MKYKYLFICLLQLAAYQTYAQCELSNLFAEAHPCEDGQVYIDFEFDYTGVSSDSIFIVRGNGMTYDTFVYGQTFYTIGPVNGDCSTIYEVVVTDISSPNCIAEFEFEEPFCCDQSCQIYGSEISVIECDTNNVAYFELNLQYQNNDSLSSFTVTANDSLVGEYLYAQDFYGIGPIYADCETEYTFIIQDDTDPFCADTIYYGSICCSDPCQNDSINILSNICQGAGSIVTFDFETENALTDSFQIYVNQQYINTYSYGQLPQSVFINDTFDINYLMVQDADNNNCFQQITLPNPCLIDHCNMSQPEYIALQCDSNNIAVTLDFYYPGDSTEVFEFVIHNTDTYQVSYHDLPFMFYYDGSIGDSLDVSVTLLSDSTCMQSVSIPNPCQIFNCNISDVIVQQDTCYQQSDQEYYFDISFDYSNLGNSTQFTITGNGQNYGTFNYGEGWYSIGPLSIDCTDSLEFIITDLLNPNCSAYTEFSPDCCDVSSNCMISSICTDIGECHSFGFDMLLDIEMEGIGNEYFELWIDNKFYDNYKFADLPIMLTNITDTNPIISIFACEVNNTSCCAGVFFSNPCFGKDIQQACQLSEINISAECTTDSTHLVIFNIDSLNNFNHTFEIWLDNFQVGTFAPDDFPIGVNGLDTYGDSTEHYVYLIDPSLDSCVYYTTIGIDCMGTGLQEVDINNTLTLPDLINIMEDNQHLYVKAYNVNGQLIGSLNKEQLIHLSRPNNELAPNIIILQLEHNNTRYQIKTLGYR